MRTIDIGGRKDILEILKSDVSPEMQVNEDLNVLLEVLASEIYRLYDKVHRFPEIIDVDYSPEPRSVAVIVDKNDDELIRVWRDRVSDYEGYIEVIEQGSGDRPLTVEYDELRKILTIELALEDGNVSDENRIGIIADKINEIDGFIAVSKGRLDVIDQIDADGMHAGIVDPSRYFDNWDHVFYYFYLWEEEPLEEGTKIYMIPDDELYEFRDDTWVGIGGVPFERDPRDDFLPYIAAYLNFRYKDHHDPDVQRNYIKYIRSLQRIRGSIWSLKVAILLYGSDERALIELPGLSELRLNELWYPEKFEPYEGMVKTWSEEFREEIGEDIPYGIILVQHGRGWQNVRTPFTYLEHVRPGGIRLDLIEQEKEENQNVTWGRRLWYAPMRMIEVSHMAWQDQRLIIHPDADTPYYEEGYRHFLDWRDYDPPEPTAPTITQHPDHEDIYHGDYAQFDVIVSGTFPMDYQWQYSDDGGSTWNDIEGAEGSAYSISSVIYSEHNGNQYRCKVSNEWGEAESDPATLTVLVDSLEFIKEPDDVEASHGEEVTFEVDAEGTTPIEYQWQYTDESDPDEGDWNNISGETSTSLSIEADYNVNHERKYRCMVFNPANIEGVSTSIATLTVVSENIVVERITEEVEVVEGGDTTVIVEVLSGTPVINFQWQKSDDDGSTWDDVAGASGDVTEVPYILEHDIEDADYENDGRLYRCKLDNVEGEVTSENILYTVKQLPSFVDHPEDKEVESGDEVVFNAEVSGTEPIEVIWQYVDDLEESEWVDLTSWTELSGTVTDYTIESAEFGDTGYYRCRASNDYGIVTSNVAYLEVTGDGPTIIEDLPDEKVVEEGDNVELSIEAEGRGELIYAWYRSEDDGATWDYVDAGEVAPPYYTINDIDTDEHGNKYKCKVTDLDDSEESNSCRIVFNFNIEASAVSEEGGSVEGDGEYEYGDNAELYANPEEGYEFIRWKEDGTEVSTDNPYIFEVTEDRTLEAKFGLKEYEVEITIEPENAGTIKEGEGEYDHGDEVTVEVEANTGYEFVRWEEGGTEVSTDNPWTFTITASRDLVAVFELKEYTVTFKDYDDTVIDEQEVEHGSDAELPDDPEREGYTFVGWDESHENITEDTVITAEYEVNTYTVSVTAEPEEAAKELSGAGDYDYDTEVELEATPEDAYEFVRWEEDGTEVSTANPWKFDMGSDDMNVVAVFEPKNTIQFEQDGSEQQFEVELSGGQEAAWELYGDGDLLDVLIGNQVTIHIDDYGSYTDKHFKLVLPSWESLVGTLDWSDKGLQGELTEDIKYLTQLERLYLSENNFSGSIPNVFDDLSDNLERLYLDDNNFTGEFPSTIEDASSLTRVDFSYNSLDEYNSGVSNTTLTHFRVSRNDFSIEDIKLMLDHFYTLYYNNPEQATKEVRLDFNALFDEEDYEFIHDISSASSDSITVTAPGWGDDDYAGDTIRIFKTSLLGDGQVRIIESNTSDTLYVTEDWDPIPEGCNRFVVYEPPSVGEQPWWHVEQLEDAGWSLYVQWS